MLRAVSLLLALVLTVAVADARTPARVCRRTCRPFFSTFCPEPGKAFRKCRAHLLRDCRQQGVAVCAGASTGLPVSTTSLPDPTTTTTTPGTGSPTTTTTLAPPTVAGIWSFQGTVVADGCGQTGLFDVVEAAVSVAQDGTALSGTIGSSPATGQVGAEGWTFVTQQDCRPSGDQAGSICCLTSGVQAEGFGSPSAAQGLGTAQCSDGIACEVRWNGSLTRSE
jgi:hypothetical protein